MAKAADGSGACWRVLMVDKDPLGSDTLSTHMVFPNTIARLDELRILESLSERHGLRPVGLRWRMLGREFAGVFTAIDGREHGLAIRRPALDRALAEAAIAAGTQARFGEKVTGLVGSGGEEDPVRGVVLGDGRARLGTLGLRSRRARLLCVASAASCLRGASIRMQKPYTRRSWRS